MNAPVSLDKKTKEDGAEDYVDQNLDGSVQDVADSDNRLKKNVSDEGLISSGNSQNNGILQQNQNDQSFDDTVVDYGQEDPWKISWRIHIVMAKREKRKILSCLERKYHQSRLTSREMIHRRKPLS